MKLLLVEDDAKTAKAVVNGLTAAGFSVDLARTGTEGHEAMRKNRHDAIVLDWMLPGGDGIDLLRTLRASGQKPPVLLLTARDALEDRIFGLESGADDYLVKPFAFTGLLARIKSAHEENNDVREALVPADREDSFRLLR